jgi:hypothetical protein
MTLYIKPKLILARQYFAENKGALFLIIGLVAVSAIIYASQHLLFLSYKNREILGIALFSVSGFFLTLDQILKIIIKDKTYKRERIYKKVAEWLGKLISKGKIRVSLFLLPIVFLVALIAILIFQAVGTGEKLSWDVIGGAIFFALIASTSYLYFLTYTNRLFNKLGNRYQRFKDDSRNMLYSNAALFVISFLLTFLVVYSGKLIGTFPSYVNMSQSLGPIIWFYVQMLLVVIWIFFSVFIITPVFILSFSYFIVLLLVLLTYFFRRPIPRFVFWVLIFMFWIIGSILLLTNAFFA